MSDRTSELVERIQSHKLPDLELRPDCIHPAYDGLSILNLPSSLANWFEADELSHPAIDLPELDDLAQGAKQIICVLVDAVALHRFQRWLGRRAEQADTMGSARR